MLRSNKCALALLTMAGAALLLAVQLASAEPPVGSSKLWPWNVQGYQAYRYSEPKAPTPPPPTLEKYQSPSKYMITFKQLPKEESEGDPNTVMLMAHLPEDALIWVEDAETKQKGTIRYFESPPLTPGKEYHYTVRVNWVEDGKWVTQTRRFPVQAGAMQCIDIVRADSDVALQDLKANLAKLSPEDRKLAEEQKFCPVQEGNLLGSMGVPVKVMVKGQPVFLCCEGCVSKAQANADRTLDKVKSLKAKDAGAAPK